MAGTFVQGELAGMIRGPVCVDGRGGGGARSMRVALLGNPNTGKTTLVNRLTRRRYKTANFPGTTLEARLASIEVELEAGTGDERSMRVDLVDLPGTYSLSLDNLEAEVCRDSLAGRLAPEGASAVEPDALVLIVDATNMPRNLRLVGEATRLRLPTVVAVNLVDLSRRRGIHIDADKLAEALGCEVVLISARTGEGVEELTRAIVRARVSNRTAPPTIAERRAWADEVYSLCASGDDVLAEDPLTDRLDRALAHPALGSLVFVLVMGAVFWSVFKLAAYPMDWIDRAFALLADWTRGALPPGDLQLFLADGIVGGVGATVIFLPQICLLFFLIAILEDTGYLARAAFVMDRVFRPFGLPGHAFVPMLSSHACALPGIMACRGIPDRRQRLAAILVAPFMSCTARIPVYVLLTSVLFAHRPMLAALAFAGCYALGAGAGLFSALIFRRTILRGQSRHMALELPSYRLPSVRNALAMTLDRAGIFLRKAGTVILAIVVVLWWMQAYPRSAPPGEALDLRAQAASVAGQDADAAAALEARADLVEARHQQASSFAGMLGRAVEPTIAPMGGDWQLGVGLVSSFAAREVFVSTLAVVVTGSDDAEDSGVLEQLATAERSDGTPLLTPATSWALLVYYVLAMQCLPTLAVTAREAGGVRWALLQLAWMNGVAYVLAVGVFQVLRLAGVS